MSSSKQKRSTLGICDVLKTINDSNIDEGAYKSPQDRHFLPNQRDKTYHLTHHLVAKVVTFRFGIDSWNFSLSLQRSLATLNL